MSQTGVSVGQAHAECKRSIEAQQVGAVQSPDAGADSLSSDGHRLVGHDLRRSP